MWWATLILLVLLWFQLWKHGGIVSDLPLPFRIQNALATTLLVFGYSASPASIIWAVVHHPDTWTQLWVKVGMFDPILVLVLWIMTQLTGIIALCMGFLAAQRKRGVNVVMAKLVPAFVFFGWMNFLLGYQQSSPVGAVGRFSGIFLGSLAVFAGVALWMRKFYGSDRRGCYFNQRLGPYDRHKE